ncbi:hypothetical protein V492_02328 [Pseudogymnoascus sp. VKM F-4246]|nr:hypothetical protein V492_02328 [Pseudogymnoascus sp. VKM F-4246]
MPPNIGYVNTNAETEPIIGSSHILPLSSAALSSRTSVTALEVYHRLNQVASQLRSLRPASDWTMPVYRPPPSPPLIHQYQMVSTRVLLGPPGSKAGHHTNPGKEDRERTGTAAKGSGASGAEEEDGGRGVFSLSLETLERGQEA